jgi:hypothetical protein
MRVDNCAGKGTSDMDEFGSVVERRMDIKLGSKSLNSLRIKTELLKRLQLVIVVDGATHTPKDGMESNRGSLKGGAEAFMLFLHGAQLVLQSSVVIVLDLDEVNVTLEDAEIFGSVLSGEGGSVGGGWQCCRSALGLPQLSQFYGFPVVPIVLVVPISRSPNLPVSQLSQSQNVHHSIAAIGKLCDCDGAAHNDLGQRIRTAG